MIIIAAAAAIKIVLLPFFFSGEGAVPPAESDMFSAIRLPLNKHT
jgi:hypothetical protein